MLSFLKHPFASVVIGGIVVACILGFVRFYSDNSDLSLLKAEVKHIARNQDKLDKEISNLLIILAANQNINDKQLDIKQEGVSFFAQPQKNNIEMRNELLMKLLLLKNKEDRKKYLLKEGYSELQIKRILMEF